MPDETPDPTDSGTPPRPGTDGDAGETDPLDRADTPPEAVVEEAERLTRLAREATVDAETRAYREDRDGLLDDHDYTARVRADETRDVLVLHPQEWVGDGAIRTDRIEDIDRGIEVPLSGSGEADEWAVIDDHNRELVAAVREAHGDVHGDNAAALADFIGNHYAKPVESATRPELEEFIGDYFPRNAWPTDEQRAVVEKSVRLVFDAADERCPL
jgi:hypothetical protein